MTDGADRSDTSGDKSSDDDNGDGATAVWPARVRARLDAVVEDGRWRAPREFDARGPGGVLDGAPVVSFASNDYLGLSAHPAVIGAAHAALDRWGAGAGASRLVTGSRPVHTELEAALAAWKGTDAAVCFPTGFAANLGALSVLGGPGVRVLSDELNHASIIDGVRLSRSPVSIYRHCDVAHLAALLESPDPGHPTTPRPSWSPTPCSPWTAMPPRWRRSRPCAAATVPCSCSMRPTPSSAPTSPPPSRPTPRSPWSAWARCRRPWARWAASWPAPGT